MISCSTPFLESDLCIHFPGEAFYKEILQTRPGLSELSFVTGRSVFYDRYDRWKKSSAIAAIIWKPALSSDRSDSNNIRMHCVPDSKIPNFPLLKDLSNPKFMSPLSFPSSFTFKSIHKISIKKKPSSRNRRFTTAMLNLTNGAKNVSDAGPLDLHSLSQRSFVNHKSPRSLNYFFQQSQRA